MGRVVTFDLATPSPQLVWDACEGQLDQEADGKLYVLLAPGSSVPFAAPGYLYKNVRSVRSAQQPASQQAPPSRPPSPQRDVADIAALAEHAAATAEAAASTAADA